MTENKKVSGKKLNLLISLLIAFVAWIYVIYNYAPMKTVTYRNVPIQFEGEDTLAYEGLGVESSSIDTIEIKAKVDRTEYTNISDEDFDVIADVSDAVEGENGISLQITAPEGTEIIDRSSSTVTVKISKSNNKDVNVAATYSDALDANLEPAVGTMSYRRVSVIGAKKNVKKVKYAAVQVKMADVSDSLEMFTLEPVAMDETGKVVKHIVVLPSEIRVSLYSGTTKEVPLKLNVSNDSSTNLKYEAVDKVVIKGSKQAIANVKEIETEEIKLDGITADTEIPLTYKLPEGIEVTKEYIHKTLKVKLKK